MTTVDQSQYQSGNPAGSGQFSFTRYRGMGFTPTLPYLNAVVFQRAKGSKDLKIYIDTADSNSLPLHAVGSELYSFTIPHSVITGGFQKFTLPQPLAVTPGTQYAFYWAPWDIPTNAYVDDYADAQWKAADVYAGGKPIVWDVTGANAWAVSDSGALDLFFETWGQSSISNQNFTRYTRPRPFAPGIGR